MGMRCGCLVVVLLCAGSISAHAAPAGLMNKSIRLTYSVAIPNDLGYPPRAHSFAIYVSSAGRVFLRDVRQSSHYSTKREEAGASFSFAGSRMVGAAKTGNGATQITVTFDSGFQSCSLDVAVGAANGKPIEWTAMDGKRVVGRGKPTVTNTSCTVQDGNVFGG